MSKCINKHILCLILLLLFALLILDKVTNNIQEQFLSGTKFEECLDRETKITPMRLASDIIKYCKSL